MKIRTKNYLLGSIIGFLIVITLILINVKETFIIIFLMPFFFGYLGYIIERYSKR